MKRATHILLAMALALGGILAGVTAGKLLPAAASLLGNTPASAEGLTAQAVGPLTPSPVGSGFTYQGRLLNNGSPTNGSYDLTFRLYDQSSTGILVSGPISVTTIITNGLFTANLDFGATAFNGDARYMEIATRQTGGGSYTTLSPRQPITPAPYALYALKTKGYKNVVTVAQDGGNFTSVQAALNSITDNSATNKYLVWVGPGVYTETVTMKQYVDIEGSGEKTTSISQVGSANSNTGTVVGVGNAELRSLTVENTGGNTYAIAILISSAGSSMSLLQLTATSSGGSDNRAVFNYVSSPSMSNVTVSASGPAGSSNYGVYGFFSSANMTDLTATASGGSNSYAVLNNYNSSPSMNNVTATASGGTFNYGVTNITSSSPNMNKVTAYASGGSPYAVYNQASSPTISNSTLTSVGLDALFNTGSSNVVVRNSQLTGNIWTASGTDTVKIGGSYMNGGIGGFGPVTCAGNYDENFVFFPNTCP